MFLLLSHPTFCHGVGSEAGIGLKISSKRNILRTGDIIKSFFKFWKHGSYSPLTQQKWLWKECPKNQVSDLCVSIHRGFRDHGEVWQANTDIQFHQHPEIHKSPIAGAFQSKFWAWDWALFKVQHCHILAVWPGGYMTSQILSFLISKMVERSYLLLELKWGGGEMTHVNYLMTWPGWTVRHIRKAVFKCWSGRITWKLIQRCPSESRFIRARMRLGIKQAPSGILAVLCHFEKPSLGAKFTMITFGILVSDKDGSFAGNVPRAGGLRGHCNSWELLQQTFYFGKGLCFLCQAVIRDRKSVV